MRYYKNVSNGYIRAIGTGYGGVEITEEEYNELLAIIHNAPITTDGYGYRLREDMTWEMYELPIIEEEDEEITDTEALDIIVGGAI